MCMKMKGWSFYVKRIAMMQNAFLPMKQIFYKMKKTYQKQTNLKNREMSIIIKETTKMQ